MARTAADENERQLITEIAREQVAVLAPQELPLFRRTSQSYFERPGDLERGAASGEVLGFGTGGAVTYITPIVLAIMVEVVTFLAAELKKQLQAESATAIAALVKRVFKRFQTENGQSETTAKSGPDAKPGADAARLSLTQQQVERVRALVLERGRALNLSQVQAELLADSLAGGLVRTP